jgi:hypothetical protein
MTTLTDEQCDAISTEAVKGYRAPPRGVPFDINTIYRLITRAAYAAGAAAAQVPREPFTSPDPTPAPYADLLRRLEYSIAWSEAARPVVAEAAAAIRALEAENARLAALNRQHNLSMSAENKARIAAEADAHALREALRELCAINSEYGTRFEEGWDARVNAAWDAANAALGKGTP